MKEIVVKKLLMLAMMMIFVACNSGLGVEVNGKNNSIGMDSSQMSEAINAMPVYDLTISQEQGLLYMWEEEKVARDVYKTFARIYNQKVFVNISKSEQSHMNAVYALISKYNIYLVGSDSVGVFFNSDFQNLYNTLVARGMNSLTDALAVGREIELLDIDDLKRELLDATPDMAYVYENLLSASYNHLNAFERRL
jgi:hypothetical protein